MVFAIIAGQYTFMAFFGLLIVGTLWEFYQIFEKNDKFPQKITGILTAIAIFFIYFFHYTGYKSHWFNLIVLSGIVTIIIELYRRKENPFENIAITWLGILYISVPISMLWVLAFRENIYQYNYHIILSYFIFIWTYDSLAYVTGMLFGKTKLFERISPKKSWEGVIGGIIFAIIAAVIISKLYNDLTTLQWIGMAVIVSVFGTFGDLAESLLKRSFGMKDSGNILPGHGGLLDRFDALFLAIPAVYLYLQFI